MRPQRVDPVESEVRPASLHTTLTVLTEDQEVTKRTECSKCGAPAAWYELRPGVGDCLECQN